MNKVESIVNALCHEAENTDNSTVEELLYVIAKLFEGTESEPQKQTQEMVDLLATHQKVLETIKDTIGITNESLKSINQQIRIQNERLKKLEAPK